LQQRTLVTFVPTLEAFLMGYLQSCKIGSYDFLLQTDSGYPKGLLRAAANKADKKESTLAFYTVNKLDRL
jgi:hypothetical protein